MEEVRQPTVVEGVPIYSRGGMKQIAKYEPEDGKVYIFREPDKTWQVDIALNRKICTCHDFKDALDIAKIYLNKEKEIV